MGLGDKGRGKTCSTVNEALNAFSSGPAIRTLGIPSWEPNRGSRGVVPPSCQAGCCPGSSPARLTTGARTTWCGGEGFKLGI